MSHAMMTPQVIVIRVL